ncbi:MAG: beta strand repeat-containing protein [Mariniblastus sp.]
MSLNRHMSSLRRFYSNKNRRRNSAAQNANDYQTLEPRQLLAVDVGIDFTSEQFGRGGVGNPADVAGAVGPNHVIEVVDNVFKIYDKFTGAELVNKPLDQFWTDGGGAGAQSSGEMVLNTNEARVLYDADTRRWFMTSVSRQDINTGLDGVQSAILVAVSRTSNPTQDWQSLRAAYDTDNDGFPDAIFDGGILPPGGNPANAGLSVDDENLYITLNQGSPFAPDLTYVLHKDTDLVVVQPNHGNKSILGGANNLHFQLDVTGTVAGTHGILAGNGGNQITWVEIIDGDIPGGATQVVDPVTVDPYEAPPVFVRQLFDPDLTNAGTEFLSAPVRHGDSLWAAHTVMSSNGSTSAIRWYEFNVNTKSVSQSGTLEHATDNYIYPSISVTGNGAVAIGHTTVGIDRFPAHSVSVGYSNNGRMVFEEPFIIKDGEGGYFDGDGNRWGDYMSTVADPDDPDKVWVFGKWSDDSFDGQTQVTELTLVGASPEIVADGNDNTIIVRKVDGDPTQIEVEIDGVVDPLNVYEEANLYRLTLDGGGGDDTFIVDDTNGEMDFGEPRTATSEPGGVVFVGDGDDQVEMITSETTNWEIGLDGSGLAGLGDDFPADCVDQHEDSVRFTLNFEPGSLWFDTTPVTDPVYTTYGEQLRGELQNYFDTVIAPVFAGDFDLAIDINDNEGDSFASATAFGQGFTDVNGQMLWVASPWSILTGRGDRTPGGSDGVINYNLDLDLYGGTATPAQEAASRQALLDNVRGGLTRSTFFNILGMESEIPNEIRGATDPRGTRNRATVMDLQYRDNVDNVLVDNYDAGDFTFEVQNYATNPGSWAGDNSGVYFLGIDDAGNPIELPVNSNSQLIDFDTLASALAGTSRDGAWGDVVEQDRAFLRGLGYDLNPVTPPVLGNGLPIMFSGVDQIQGGSGVDNFCIRSSNVDLEISGGIGNDQFIVTGLGVGAIDLLGEAGDDTYDVTFSPEGVITIIDSVGTESDTLIGRGSTDRDTFIFDEGGVNVNDGLLVYVGVENGSFDGLENDDTFIVRGNNATFDGVVEITGGDGNDSFIVDAGGNANTLGISVNDPAGDPADQLLLEIGGPNVTEVFLGDTIENYTVDGSFVVDDVNGTPTVAGGINLIGDGDDHLNFETTLDALWDVTSDGTGIVTTDVEPMTFTGLDEVDASHAVDTVNVTMTGTDMTFRTREANDVININNTGAGIVTVEAGDGEDTFNVVNSGGGVELFGGNDNDLYNVANNGGPINLFGEMGDDTYVVDMNSTGDVNIVDSPNTESDTLIANGTAGGDHFIFDVDGMSLGGGGGGVGAGSLSYVGIENFDFEAGDGDDLFEVRGGSVDIFTIDGGVGNDRFWVNDMGMGGNANTLTISVRDPLATPADQLRLDIASYITDTFYADSIENFEVDGSFILDTINGTPTVAGGLNLIGDGDEELIVNSSLAAGWEVTGDGAGTLTMDVEPATFSGLSRIEGSQGVDTVNVSNTGTDLFIDTRDGEDLITIDNVGAGIVTAWGGLLADTINVLNAGLNGVIVDGKSGDDVMSAIGVGGLISLIGSAGDDTFNIDFSAGGMFSVTDVVALHNDRLFGTGTGLSDTFVFDGDTVTAAGGTLSYVGVETLSFDGLGGDDMFEVRSAMSDDVQFVGGLGSDTFMVNDMGVGANGNVLDISVDQPSQSPADRLRLDVSSVIADTFYSDEVENFIVDGSFILNGTKGTPTVAGGLNLLGDGNDRLFVESMVDAGWLVNGDGAGVLTMDVDPATFIGMTEIDGSHGVDDFSIINTATDLIVRARDSSDTIVLDNIALGFVTVDAGMGDDSLTVFNSGGGATMLGNLGDDTFVASDLGASATTMLGGDGDDNFSVTNSGGGITQHGESGNDTFLFSDAGTGMASLDGGDGMDDFTVLNSGTAGLTIDGAADVDTFTIDDLVGTATTVVFGGSGNDQYTVLNAGLGTLTLRGELDDDSYFVQNVDPVANFSIIDSINAENDSLNAFGTPGDDTFDINSSNPSFNGAWNIIGIENFDFDGLAGDDTFNINMDSSWTGTITLHGGSGDDTFNVINGGSGTINMFGDSGNDTYIVNFNSTTNLFITDSIGSEFDKFVGFGTTGDDTITHSIGLANVNGASVNLVGIEDVEYDGLAGDDVFNVNSTSGTNLFRGNDGDDLFRINAVTDTNTFLGDAGSDRFLVNNHVAGATGTITIDGGTDQNQMVVTGSQTATNDAVINRDLITGLSTLPISYTATGGTFTNGSQDNGVTLIGADGFADLFEVNTFLATNTLTMLGGGGIDRFTVREGALGTVVADGQQGSDLYQLALGTDQSRRIFALDSGTDTDARDRIVAQLTASDDNLVLSGESFQVNTDRVGFNMNFEAMYVNGKEGNDTIEVNRMSLDFLRIIGESGDDVINVNNFTGINQIRVDAGDDNDTIALNAGTQSGIFAGFGGDGDDTFTVTAASFGNANFDGQNGSDTYDVFYTDRADRLIVAVDSGVSGSDRLTVHGTVLDDPIMLRSGLVKLGGQSVIYNERTEILNVMAAESADRISIFGMSAPTTNVMGQGSEDLIFVNSTFGPAPSKTLNIDAGEGNDTVVIRGTNADTTTNVFGREGNDSINIGSSLADNNGSLDLIRGSVHVEGNSGDDRLYMNDLGKQASYNYNIGPALITNGGNGANTFFGGVSYGSMETLRLDATDFRNQINVTASSETKYNFFGMGGYNTITLQGDASVDGRKFFGQNGGNGFWNFSNGFKDVFFSNFFIV